MLFHLFQMLNRWRIVYLVMCFPLWAGSQDVLPDTLVLDSLAIEPSSVRAYWDTIPIPEQDIQVDPWKGRVMVSPGYDLGKLRWTYSTYPFRTWIGRYPPQSYQEYFKKGVVKSTSPKGDVVNGIKTTGVISRGIQIGNLQNLSVQSGMNLQLNGWINGEWQIKGSLSDANIPIQPGGTSAKLEDFDQIYILLNNTTSEITAGDFFSKSWDGQYLRFSKRSQGLKYQFKNQKTQLELGTSISKGRFARQVIQGVEGNQGPYRLVGAQGENYIIVLAGTEIVYIDGVKLNRGQEKDYVIDYNTGLLTFMPTILITKDKRITVEFQYSDKQYIRPLITAQWNQKCGSGQWYGRYFNESDAKNQPLQLNLNDSAQLILAQAGDAMSAQYMDGSQLVENWVGGAYYRKIDTLGFQGVWTYSQDTTQQLYQVTFSYAGMGNGDYRESGYAASGKIYQWVAPVWDGLEWIHQGDFIDKAQLTAPKRLQVISMGWKDQIQSVRGRLHYATEGALSAWDQNTFSSLDDGNNVGWASQSKVLWLDSLKRFNVSAGFEFQSSYFQRVERFREVEFERNWNLLGLLPKGNWRLTNMEVSVYRPYTRMQLQFEQLNIGSEWNALRARWKGNILTTPHWNCGVDGWYTQSTGLRVANFIRNKDVLEFKWSRWRLYYQDEWERNRMDISTGGHPYAFWDYSFGVGTLDTVQKKCVVFYRNRWDQLPLLNQNQLANSTRAEHWGVDLAWQLNAQFRLFALMSQRQLTIIDEERFSGTPENSIVGRAGFQWKDRKQVWWINGYYQLGSGLEQRRSYVYLEVPMGQGSFVWVDYNDNGVKELNEFEIPAFGYEANYIRSQVPTADFVQVGSAQANASIQWRPQSSGWKRWSNVMNVQTEAKQQSDIPYSPWEWSRQDTSWVQSLWMLRNQLQYNTTDPKWGANLAYQWNQTKNSLTMGYEWREDRFISPQLRWNVHPNWTLMPTYKEGRKSVLSDFLIGRNYKMQYRDATIQSLWRVQKVWTLTLSPEYVEKRVQIGEGAVIKRCLGKVQYQSPQRTMWQGEWGFHDIRYSGTDKGSLQYDLLEGLRTGRNYTWSVQWQTMTGKLQWSLLYNGRKSGKDTSIHTGMIQVKAVF